MIGTLGAFWGLAGVSLLLGSAVYRLTLVSVEALSHELLWYHWMALVLNVLFMAYSEGYQGFQLGFSPRVAARALVALAAFVTLAMVAVAASLPGAGLPGGGLS